MLRKANQTTQAFFGWLSILLFSSTIAYAQTGPGGVGSNDGGSSLNLWLRSDRVNTLGNDVIDWIDLSGYGHNFTQGTSANRPTLQSAVSELNDRPAIDFSGSEQYINDDDGESYVNGNTEFSIFIVSESDVVGTDRGIFDTEAPDGDDDNLALRYDNAGASGGEDDVLKGATGAGNSFETSSLTQSLDPQIISFYWTSGETPTLKLNGSLNTLSYGPASTGTIAGATFFTIGQGAKDEGAADGWDGRIAEMIYYDRKLNDAQVTIIENYLSAQYGLSISNDRYVGDEAAQGDYDQEVIGIGKDALGSAHAVAAAGGLSIAENGGTLGNNDFLLAGYKYNNNLNTADLGGIAGLEARWERDWYFDFTNASGLRIDLVFDIEEAGFSTRDLSSANATDYKLLYRSGTTGDWTEVATANSVDNANNAIAFANLLVSGMGDGYFTIGTVDQMSSPVGVELRRTWYSYQSGVWSDPDVWTLDGSVSPILDNPANETPGVTDNVIITTGRTITMDVNNITVGSMEIINQLNLAATNGHDFTMISGTGRILMTGSGGSDNFPDGDASAFADATNGGTVEIYGTGVNLDRSHTFNDLVINMSSTANQVTQLADIALNGDLMVMQGEYQINNNTATTPLDLEVGGDVLVDVNGSMSVGPGNAYTDNLGGTYGDYHRGFHEVFVHGNFTNNGGVRFTNQTVPDYNDITTTGAVSLVFTGTTNNIFSCNTTTDLYNLVIDKGVDRTYELELNATNKTNFALFGANDHDWNRGGGNEANPETQKALWIKAGALRVTGNTFIPSLSEGGRDYTIGKNAALVVDGENVEVHNTANEDSNWSGFSHGNPDGVSNNEAQQGLYPFGKLQVDDGYFWLGEAKAINFRDEAPGIIEVNGGELSAAQIAISSSASSGVYTFTLNGGRVRLTDYKNRAGDDRAIFHLDDPSSVFTMTGGELIVEGITSHTTGGVLISSDPGNISVSGGTVRANYAGTVEVNTTAPFYDLVVETHTLNAQSELKILNDVTIRTGTTRGTSPDVYGGYLDLCPDGTNCFDLEVGRHLTIEDNAVLDVFTNGDDDDAGSATLTFNGTENGVLYVGDITSYTAALTDYDDPDGDESYVDYRLPLYDVVIDKSGSTLQLQAKNPGVEDGAGILTATNGKNLDSNNARLLYIRNGLTIASSSTLNQIDPIGNQFGYIVRVYANNINVDGNLLVYEQGVNPVNSFLEVRERDEPTVGDVVQINATEGSTIGNLVVDLGNDELRLGSDLTVTRMAYRHGGVNLGTYNLKVDILDLNTESNNNDNERLRNGNGEYLFGDNTSGAEQYFFTAGNTSDGGLSIKVPRTTNVHGTNDEQNVGFDPSYDNRNNEYQNNNLLFFPIGIKDKYTPAVCYIINQGTNSYDDDEYITVRPVDAELQTTSLSLAPASDGILSYYWNIGYEGFDAGGEPTVSWLFQYDQDDVNTTDYSQGEGNYVPGKVLDGGAYTRSDDGDDDAVKNNGISTNEGGNIMGNNPGNIIIFNGITLDTDNNDNIDSGTGDNIFNDGGTPDLTNNPVDDNWQNAFPGTGFALENANYTAGVEARFIGAPEVYYTRQDVTFDFDNNAWSSPSTWSTEGHNSNTNAGTYPEEGDIAYVGFDSNTGGNNATHKIHADTEIDIASLVFTEYIDTSDNGKAVDTDDGSASIVSLSESDAFGGGPVLVVPAQNDLNLGQVSGGGRLQIIVGGTGQNPDPDITTAVIADLSGDFGLFSQNLASAFYFDLRNSSLNSNSLSGDNAVYVPASYPTEYPNILIRADNGGFIVFQEDIQVNGEFRLRDGGSVLLNDGVGGDITVDGDLVYQEKEGETERIEFPNTGSRMLTINGDINLTREDNDDPDHILVRNTTPSNALHTLRVGGSINIGDDGDFIRLYNTGANANQAILELIGESDQSYNETSGDPTLDLYQISMNKGTDQTYSFTFNDAFDIADPAVTGAHPFDILNGVLILNNSAIDVELADASTGSFPIPNTTNAEASSGSGGLEIRQGVARVEGNNTGITLDGLLRISGGELDMDDANAANNGNNFIEYSATGNAALEINDGTLTVGSQIRRSTASTSGILTYRQTGGTVEVGTQAAPSDERGVFEVLNAGSEFTLNGGDFTILRQNGTSPTVAALLLEPTDYNVTGSTINIGGVSTPAGQTIGINSAIPLNNLTINTNSSPTAQITGRNITINGTTTISTGATLDADVWDMTLGGDFVNDGAFVTNGNTTTFNGATAQQISGSAAGGTTFYNMTQSGANTLLLSSHNITVANDLRLESGTFDDAGNTVTLLGNMTHDGTHITSASGGEGIVFAGSSQQQLVRTIAGSSDFGKLTINNSSGVRIPDGNGYNFMINESLRLSAGVFDIGSSLLTVDASATIEEVNTFGANNMIQTNSSFTDNGVKRVFDAIESSTDLVFPIGQTKYTPVVLDITSSDAGSLTIRPANEMHPSIVEDSEAPDTEIVDADNVLQYHWIIKAENITGLSGTATMTYSEADVEVTSPYSESDYIPARIYADDTEWDKLTTSDINTANNTIQFPFASVTDAEITGDYTAGIPNAIPDRIPTYETSGDGSYTAQSTWIPVDGSPAVTDGVGPVGAIIIVRNGDVVTLNQNNIRVYSTEIEAGGILEVDDTFGHRLGTVTGTGDIRIASSTSSAVLPAGFYGDFFGCTGGGLEYAGTGSYDILGGITSLNNLTLSGSGARTLPNNAVTVCNDLTVQGPTLSNVNNQTITVQNDFLQSSGTYNNSSGTLLVENDLSISGGTFNSGTGSKTVDRALILSNGTLNVGSNGTFLVRGDVTYSGGTFNGGSGNAVFLLAGGGTQTVSGAFTGAATFHRLQVNNSAGINFAGNAEVSTELRLTNGIVNNGSNTFTLAENATVAPIGGSSSSYVNGQFRKIVASGSDFTFPIGKNRYAPVSIDDVSSSNVLTWRAEYFPQNAEANVAQVDNMDPSNDGENIETISQGEYWIISDDAGAAPTGAVTAEVGLSWGGNSDVSANSTDYDDLRVMWWDDAGSHWDNAGRSSHSGTQAFGRLYASLPISFSEKVVTFGSTSTNNALPVELISFKAAAQAQSVLLIWETASEIDNDYFEVQRSVDGTNFKKIGEVAGHGTTSELMKYEFVDKLPIAGISYYRLKQVDYNGMYEYSDAVSAEWVNEGAYAAFVELNLYPNPAPRGEAKLRVTGLQPQSTVTIKLIDMFGKTYLQQVVESNQLGQNGYVIRPRVRLAAGVYVVSVQQGSQVHQKTLVVR